MLSRLPSLCCATLLASLPLLAGCPTVDLGELPVPPGACRPDALYFEDVIWPEFIDTGNMATSCVDEGGCHQIGNNPKSSFRVSLAEPIDYTENYKRVSTFLNCDSPASSSLLTRPISNVDPHGGGDLFAPGSPSEQAFLSWFLTP